MLMCRALLFLSFFFVSIDCLATQKHHQTQAIPDEVFSCMKTPAGGTKRDVNLENNLRCMRMHKYLKRIFRHPHASKRVSSPAAKNAHSKAPAPSRIAAKAPLALESGVDSI